MEVTPTAIPEVLILEPKVFGDERGFFTESFNQRTFREVTGLDCDFVQDNHSRSTHGTLRGLHYQMECPQGKLVRVTSGCVFDAVVDMRKGSPTFGASVSATLSGDNHRQLWVPPGFAHGFLVLSPSADFLYKTTDYYHPASEQTLKWDDAALAIEWPLDGLSGPLIVSEKDAKGLPLEACQVYP